MTRRGHLLSRLKIWQQVCAFLIAAAAIGSGIGFAERTFGIAAAWLGFATERASAQGMAAHKVEHTAETAKILAAVERIQLWQLYDQIKRTQRNIDNLKEKKALTLVEREQLQDYGTQLIQATEDYRKLVDKIKSGQP